MNNNIARHDNETTFSLYPENGQEEKGLTVLDHSYQDYHSSTNYHCPTVKNYRSLLNYIDNLFQRHGRLLVLRVDLTYRKDVDNRFLNDIENWEKCWQAKKDREHLFRNMRSNKLFNHLLGYAWKLEFGSSKGWHYHTFFFFDGSKLQHDVHLANMIGEYWVNVITQGRGLSFNCNLKKDDYKHLGIGMINHYDTELIANLKNQVASYLTKSDDYTRLKTQNMDIGRTFGRSEIKLKTNNRGRPRNAIDFD